MVGAARGGIDEGILEPAGKCRAHQGIVEKQPLACSRWPLPAVTSRGPLAEMGMGIDGKAPAGDPSVIGVLLSEKAFIVRRFRLQVEIAERYVILRRRRIRHAEIGRPRHRHAFGGYRLEPALQAVYLCHALFGRHMIEMHGINADRAARRGNHRLQRRTLQVEPVIGAAARQHQASGGQNGVAREDHVAEIQPVLDHAAVPFLHVEENVDGRVIGAEMPGQARLEAGHHVVIAVAGKIARHLLKGDDIGSLDGPGDAVEIVAPVKSDAILDIVACKFHDNL